MCKINHSAAAVGVGTRLRSELVRFLISAGSERGLALVEFALVLPVLLLVVTGITTFGIALNNYMQLTQAVGIGAQALSVSRGNTTDPCNTVSSAVISAAPYLVSTSLSFTTKIYTSSTASTSYSGTSCSSSSTTTGAAGNLTQGQAAVVTATYPCSLAVFGANYASSCSLSAQVTEIIQ
jgi:Flp pilus assembly protein TadG